MTINEICNLLAQELPDDFTIKLTLEKDSGSVDVEQWREPDWDMGECEHGSIEERLLEALRMCKEADERMGRQGDA